MLLFLAWHRWLQHWTESLNLSLETSKLAFNASVIMATLLLAVFSFWATKWVSRKIARFLSKKSKLKVVETLEGHRFFTYLSYQLPLWIIKDNLPAALSSDSNVLVLVQRLYELGVVALALVLANSILNSLVALYQHKERNRSKPIKGLVQFVQIIIVSLGVIAAISILFDVSKPAMVTGLGAASAVLMLIFKDSITGLVAGVQLSFNKMIEIGDWISLPKYDVDGEVIDITITSVKVRNWDKSVSSVPSYSLVISDSVKNWKAMLNEGARKMTRIIYLDVLMVKPCTPEDLERYKQLPGVEEALNLIDEKAMLTNLGVFRAYITHYLLRHNKVNSQYEALVRPLQAVQYGLPLEISCFIDLKASLVFENTQSEILEYLLAIVSFFDLNVFQSKPDEKIIGGIKK